MYHHPVEFLLEILAQIAGILGHPVHADEHLAADDVVLPIVETDDVGVGVVIQILDIEFEKLLVAAKKLALM